MHPSNGATDGPVTPLHAFVPPRSPSCRPTRLRAAPLALPPPRCALAAPRAPATTQRARFGKRRNRRARSRLRRPTSPARSHHFPPPRIVSRLWAFSRTHTHPCRARASRIPSGRPGSRLCTPSRACAPPLALSHPCLHLLDPARAVSRPLTPVSRLCTPSPCTHRLPARAVSLRAPLLAPASALVTPSRAFATTHDNPATPFRAVATVSCRAGPRHALILCPTPSLRPGRAQSHPVPSPSPVVAITRRRASAATHRRAILAPSPSAPGLCHARSDHRCALSPHAPVARHPSPCAIVPTCPRSTPSCPRRAPHRALVVRPPCRRVSPTSPCPAVCEPAPPSARCAAPFRAVSPAPRRLRAPWGCLAPRGAVLRPTSPSHALPHTPSPHVPPPALAALWCAVVLYYAPLLPLSTPWSPPRTVPRHLAALLCPMAPCCALWHRVAPRCTVWTSTSLPVLRPRHALVPHGAVLCPTTPSQPPSNPPALSYIAAPQSAAPRHLDLHPFASRPVALSCAPLRRVTPSCTPQWLQYCNFYQCCLSCYCLSK
ncbi:hypothetical protein DENSPDRAFT_886312 [Dentipellis sp. KUC8613]|nr:hypothetical protein DENSPDRAFT_886312 [Dentipellis sp. KUC8613]